MFLYSITSVRILESSALWDIALPGITCNHFPRYLSIM